MNELSVIATETHETAVAYFKVAEQYGYKSIMEIKKMRDQQYYKAIGFDSFESYCQKAWNYQRDFMDERILIAEELGKEWETNGTYRQMGHKKSLMLARMDTTQRKEATQAIESGTINTVNELKQWQKDKQRMEMDLKVANGQVAKLSEKLEEEMNKPAQTQTIEKPPADYEETKRKNVEIQKKLEKAEEDALNSFRANLLEKDRYVIHDTLSTFVQTVGKHVKKLEFEVKKHPGDREIQRDIQAAIETLQNAISQMEEWPRIKNMQRREVIIDGSFTS